MGEYQYFTVRLLYNAGCWFTFSFFIEKFSTKTVVLKNAKFHAMQGGWGNFMNIFQYMEGNAENPLKSI